MANLDTFPGIDECIFCLGEMRVATKGEVKARLRSANPAYRASVEQSPGTWYVCPRCGPESLVKWHSIGWD
jgi:hypothetical protein